MLTFLRKARGVLQVGGKSTDVGDVAAFSGFSVWVWCNKIQFPVYRRICMLAVSCRCPIFGAMPCVTLPLTVWRWRPSRGRQCHTCALDKRSSPTGSLSVQEPAASTDCHWHYVGDSGARTAQQCTSVVERVLDYFETDCGSEKNSVCCCDTGVCSVDCT